MGLNNKTIFALLAIALQISCGVLGQDLGEKKIVDLTLFSGV